MRGSVDTLQWFGGAGRGTASLHCPASRLPCHAHGICQVQVPQLSAVSDCISVTQEWPPNIRDHVAIKCG